MNCKNFLEGQTCMQQHLFEYFSKHDYCSFPDYVIITFIEKTHPKGPKPRGTLMEACP